jgi:hypothetical protein
VRRRTHTETYSIWWGEQGEGEAGRGLNFLILFLAAVGFKKATKSREDEEEKEDENEKEICGRLAMALASPTLH